MRNTKKLDSIIYPVLERQRTYSKDFLCRRKDGRDILFRLSAAVIGDYLEDKKIVAVYEDITEKKKAEKELQKEKEKFSVLLENVPFGVASIEKKRHILTLREEKRL
jgi:PAS domain-containing protein